MSYSYVMMHFVTLGLKTAIQIHVYFFIDILKKHLNSYLCNLCSLSTLKWHNVHLNA